MLAQGLLELGGGPKEAVVRGSLAEQLPEALDDVELGAVAGQAQKLDVQHLVQCSADAGTAMPGGVVEGDDHAREVLFGISSAHVAQVASEGLLHAASATEGLFASLRRGTLQQSGRQLRSDEVYRSEGVDLIFVVPGADGGAVPFDPQRAHQRRHKREARFVLAQ